MSAFSANHVKSLPGNYHHSTSWTCRSLHSAAQLTRVSSGGNGSGRSSRALKGSGCLHLTRVSSGSNGSGSSSRALKEFGCLHLLYQWLSVFKSDLNCIFRHSFLSFDLEYVKCTVSCVSFYLSFKKYNAFLIFFYCNGIVDGELNTHHYCLRITVLHLPLACSDLELRPL